MFNPKRFNPLVAKTIIELQGKYLGFLKKDAEVMPNMESGKVLILPENNRELLKVKVEQKNPDSKTLKKKGK